MQGSYKSREIELFNSVISHLPSLNVLETPVITDNLDQSSIIEVGTTMEDKLFLLNWILDDIVAQHQPESGELSEELNSNAVSLINLIRKMLPDIEATYTVKIETVPGLSLPCSTIYEAKQLANSIAGEAHVLYQDQIIYSKAN